MQGHARAQALQAIGLAFAPPQPGGVIVHAAISRPSAAPVPAPAPASAPAPAPAPAAPAAPRAPSRRITDAWESVYAATADLRQRPQAQAQARAAVPNYNALRAAAEAR